MAMFRANGEPVVRPTVVRHGVPDLLAHHGGLSAGDLRFLSRMVKCRASCVRVIVPWWMPSGGVYDTFTPYLRQSPPLAGQSATLLLTSMGATYGLQVHLSALQRSIERN